jgi:hypothetical protein
MSSNAPVISLLGVGKTYKRFAKPSDRFLQAVWPSAFRSASQTADAAALEAAGAGQRGQSQAELTAAYQQFQNQQLYPKQQADFLSTQIRGMAPITPQTTNTSGATTTFAPSPLSQFATGMYAYKGLNALGQPTN